MSSIKKLYLYLYLALIVIVFLFVTVLYVLFIRKPKAKINEPYTTNAIEDAKIKLEEKTTETKIKIKTNKENEKRVTEKLEEIHKIEDSEQRKNQLIELYMNLQQGDNNAN